MILDDIVKKKKAYLQSKKNLLTLDEIKKKAQETTIKRRSFSKAISQEKDIAIIGEIKKASPSKGLIRESFDPAAIANEYSKSNVQALSVLTERDFFLGDESYIAQARARCNLPVLRKDFIIDKWQIYESYLLKADAILLIAAILDDSQLSEFYKIAQSLELDALVEVHDEKELERALKTDPQIIGINNRNLNDFTVSIETTKRLKKLISSDKIIVSESGIRSAQDVTEMRAVGVDALLIGETLMRAKSIKDAVVKLRGTL